jgi:hypothetical protein
MSLNENPLPRRASSTSLYSPTASDNGLPAVAASAAEIVKCCGKSVRPASVTTRRAGTGQLRAEGTSAARPLPFT